MTTSVNTTANNVANTAAANIIVPSFIDANYNAGRLSVGIYHMAERTITEAINFTNAANALNYAFLLKKRHGINIARRAFDLIMWEIKRTGAISTRAQRRAEAAKATAEPTAEPTTEPTEAPTAEKVEKPKRKRTAKVAETPLMKQYKEMKKKHPDAVLLFRCGDFYECFGEDAVKASEILGITLTRRANGKAEAIELAGFPHHALDNYLPKLVRAGQRIAICEQLEDPKAKTIANA